MNAILIGLLNRFKEPSSWAGIGVVLGAVGLSTDTGLLQSISFIGAGVAGVLSFFITEQK